MSATKLLNEIPKYKLDGFGVARSVMQEINFVKSSNYKATNFVRQAQFLSSVLKKLEEDPQSITNDLYRLRSLLTCPEALHVQVVADILSLPEPKKLWVDFIPAKTPRAAEFGPAPTSTPQHSRNYLSHAEGQGHLVQVPGLESSFLMQTSESVAPALSFSSPPEEIAAVMVAGTYFTMMEGLFWRLIRGAGLSYSFNIAPRLEESLILFYLYRSANIVKAYETAVKIISDLIDGKDDFDPMSLIEARSSCVHEIVEKAITASDAARESLLDYLRQWDRNGYHEVLKHVQTVSVDQLRAALNKYIKPIFETKHSNLVVTTSATKSDEAIRGFEAAGAKLTVIENLESFVL